MASSQVPAIEYWPEGKALPAVYRHGETMPPCAHCKAWKHHGSPAVRVLALQNGFAQLQCSACGQAWQCPWEHADSGEARALRPQHHTPA